MRFVLASIVLAVAAAAVAARAQDDIVFRAMQDEMDRSMKQLQLENLDKPYFISYRVEDEDSTTASASFGGLASSNQNRLRMLRVEVRVGSYQLDNTNYSHGLLESLSVLASTKYLPLDDDYTELRRQIWLATDGAYKKATEDLARKRAALLNKNIIDLPPDFTQEKPAQTVVTAAPVHADRAAWEAEARTLSALFRQMPEIADSGVAFSASNLHIRYLNSEGTRYTIDRPNVGFSANAIAQATDGRTITDSTTIHVRTLQDLPPAEELTARIRALSKRLKEVRDAAVLDTYTGPVLFESNAAPQLFRLNFASDLEARRRALPDNLQNASNFDPSEGHFIDKIGERVLPKFLSVTDNPTIDTLDGKPIDGFCKIDDDGLPTHEIKLVADGNLQTLLTTRNPVRGFDHSSASRHGNGAAPTNLIVTAEDGLSSEDLRAKLLEQVKQQNKDYGIVVRRMHNSSQPLLAWKVYADGHEEEIRGVEFSGLGASSFKKIAAAGSQPNLLNEGTVTYAVPSLLFKELTLHKLRGETPTLPLLPHPFFDGK
jgi:predicted Zn-dependent protease